MRAIALLLAYLAFASHGFKLQASSAQSQDHPHKDEARTLSALLLAFNGVTSSLQFDQHGRNSFMRSTSSERARSQATVLMTQPSDNEDSSGTEGNPSEDPPKVRQPNPPIEKKSGAPKNRKPDPLMMIAGIGRRDANGIASKLAALQEDFMQRVDNVDRRQASTILLGGLFVGMLMGQEVDGRLKQAAGDKIEQKKCNQLRQVLEKPETILQAVDILAEDVPKLLHEDPKWGIFTDDFTVVSEVTGSRVEGLQANKLWLNLMRSTCATLSVEGEISIEFDPALREWLQTYPDAPPPTVDMRLPNFERKPRGRNVKALLTIRLLGGFVNDLATVDTVFHLDQNNLVDKLIIQRWA